MVASAQFFSADATSPALARRWASRVLASWRVPESQQSDMLLVVSELTTNAVIHAHSAFVVVVHQSADGLGVAVGDNHTAVPSRRSPSPDRVDGRGLRIVQTLTRKWGVRRVPGDGKIVWAKLAY